MKLDNKFKYLTTIILIISFLCSPFSLLIVEAADGYQNNTASYNCYAYAINRVVISGVFYRPNSYKPTYQPGDISEDIYNNFDVDFYGYDLNRVKCNVIKDLYAMGYTDVLIYSNIEDDNAYNSMLADIDFSTQELICLRVGTTDYHFMRYDSATTVWYNKLEDGLIFEYTDNNGIPSNDIAWTGSGNIYDSDIMYIIYNKLQAIIPESGEWEGSITVKGGVSDISADNYVFCCGNEACCNPYGICECENKVINGGKDVLYEIVVPKSGNYTIQITTPTVINNTNDIANFNYEIYSYNMYNGNYQILAQGSGTSGQTFTAIVNLTAYDDYNDGSENWQYQTYKHYIRLDFERENTTDQDVNVNISHVHDYTETVITDSYHGTACFCGQVGETEEHYYYSYARNNKFTHFVNCECGYYIGTSFHVVPAGNALIKFCIHCGEKLKMSEDIVPVPGSDMQSTNRITYITEYGSYVDKDGIIYLVESDMALYLAGELDVYALAQSAGGLVTE